MDQAKIIILQAKCARIIELLADKFDGDRVKAVDVFYNSCISQFINDGVADLHCRSDHYLADEVYREYLEHGSFI